jgi:hypothetical protein
MTKQVLCSYQGYSTTQTVQFLAILTIFPEILPNKNSSL